MKKVRDEFLPFCAPTIENEEITEVVKTLKSGWITTGPRVKEFEERFALYQKVKNPIAVTSATAALHLILHALNLQSDDEVITPSLSWVSAANMIELVGAKTVFCDIDEATLQLSLEDVKSKITSKTKAIIPVHFAGQPYDIDGLRELTMGKGIVVIEDAAHAVGTKYKGNFVGTVSDFSVFSFHPIKNITTGEGGMLVCNNSDLAYKLKLLKFHGIAKDSWQRYNSSGDFAYEVVEPGFKYNMMDIQAGLGIKQLEKLDDFIAKRQALSDRYDEFFQKIEEIEPQGQVNYSHYHARHLYVIRLDTEKLSFTRNEFMQTLKEMNIGTGLHFVPIHLQKYYSDKYGYKSGDLPATEFWGSRILSLPLFPKMTFKDQDDVFNAIGKIIRGK